MRIVITFIFLFTFNGVSIGQPDLSVKKYAIIQNSEQDSFSVLVQYYAELKNEKWEKIPGFYEVFLIDNSYPTDTTSLLKYDWFFPDLDTISARFIALDKKGPLGILITFRIKESRNLGESGFFSVLQTTQEIWNSSTKQKLFSIVSDYSCQGEFLFWDDSTSTSSTTNYFYNYDFDVSQKNKITIKNLKTNLLLQEDNSPIIESSFPSYCECNELVNIEGIYIYKKGKYQLRK